MGRRFEQEHFRILTLLEAVNLLAWPRELTRNLEDGTILKLLSIRGLWSVQFVYEFV